MPIFDHSAMEKMVHGALLPDPRLLPDSHLYDPQIRYREMGGEEELDDAEFDLDEKSECGVRERWDDGWKENLESLKRAIDDGTPIRDSLIPGYLAKGDTIFSIDGKVAKSTTPMPEYKWFRCYTNWLFSRYMSSSSPVYEVGSGSGINMFSASADRDYYGLDWSEAAVEIARILGGAESRGILFNAADFNCLPFPGEATVLTVGCMEQLSGESWVPFMESLLDNRQSLVVNVEPIFELYNPEIPVDMLAMKHHLKRNYWVGFMDWLNDAERSDDVEILRMRKITFGSLYTRGYNHFIWRANRRRIVR